MIVRSAAVHSAVRNKNDRAGNRGGVPAGVHHKHAETPKDIEKYQKQLHGRAKAEAHEVGPTRRKNARERVAHRKKIEEMTEDEEIITLFKKSEDGCIGKEGLVHLISIMKPNEVVEQTEIDWIMAMADRFSHQRIAPAELKDVKAALEAYIKSRRNVKHWLQKFDFDRDGAIDASELQRLLEGLNDGVCVSDEEVTWVMNNTSRFQKGTLVVPELENAINFWYNHAYAPPEEATLPFAGASKKGGSVGRAMVTVVAAGTIA